MKLEEFRLCFPQMWQPYQVDNKVLNQTIKRNINRFPDSFCFQLTNGEIDELCLRSQFVTLNIFH